MDKYQWRNIKRARTLEGKAFIMLGDDWGGNPGPPGQNVIVRTDYADEAGVERVFSWGSNDGFDLGIGYPDEWHVFINRKEAAALWWAITRRALSTWFGVRRWLWYKLLNRRVERTRNVEHIR